jgi:HD-GYP domain-containing protein (c-di-GMP phosphodiesterase class II)
LSVAAGKDFRRLLSTLGSLAELGPELTGEQDFRQNARSMLALVMDCVGTSEGVLFIFNEKPSQLRAVAWKGFAFFPDSGFIPLLARQINALLSARKPQPLIEESWETYLSSNGNVAPDLFKCIVPLRVGTRLAGLVALGAREGDARYQEEDLQALATIAHYVALAVHNHTLTETLQQRVVEHLKLLESVHAFCDQTMEVFAAAIDAKEFRSRGHSLRVGRYASAIGTAFDLNANEVAELRAAGYLHDIGKVAVDKRLFSKAAKLEPSEFREMADHTIVGHQIISAVHFPWPRIAEVVRWHHERSDGSGYPDKLRNDQLSLPVRIIAVMDSFDAMTSERAYRQPLSIGQTLSEIVRLAPQKYDGDVVQALLMQVRAEAAGRGRFLDPQIVCGIAPSDVDQLAADLKYKMTRGRVYSA